MVLSDSPTHRLPDHRSVWKAIGELVLVVGGGLLLILAIVWVTVRQSERIPVAGRTSSTRAGRAEFIGSENCRECHPGETASHARSGHSKTLRPVAQTPLAKRLNGAKFADPERPGVTWSYALRDGKLSTERREADEIERFVIDYAFGSGHHATTLVSLTGRDPTRPTMIEHRQTVLAHKDLPDITPGQSLTVEVEGNSPSGRRYSDVNTLKCFECHTTVMSESGPNALSEATMIPNIGCERCHGPGRSHVEAARGGAEETALAMPFGRGRWSPAMQLKLCGACHRLPEMGDPALLRPDNPVLARFQPVGLMLSACYLKGQGEMSCLTCHDPHARTSTDLKAYEAVCLSCHQGSSRKPCKVSPEKACVGCHMPKRDVSRGMMMTDHWIRSRPETTANAPPLPVHDPSSNPGSE